MPFALPNPKEWMDQLVQSGIAKFHAWMEHSRETWFDFVAWLYTETTKLFFYTPLDLIANPKVQALTEIFLELAVWGVGIGMVIEGIRIIFAGKAESLGQIMARCVIGLVATFTAPNLMVTALWVVNKICHGVLLKSQALMSDAQAGDMIASYLADAPLGLIGSLIFVIVYLYFLVKLLLVLARRFFDLVVQTSISPLACLSYVFESTQKYFSMWLQSTVNLYLFQLVYVVYFTIFAILIITPLPADWNFIWLKILLLLGGLWRISNPPQWMQQFAQGGDTIALAKKIWAWKKKGSRT